MTGPTPFGSATRSGTCALSSLTSTGRCWRSQTHCTPASDDLLQESWCNCSSSRLTGERPSQAPIWRPSAARLATVRVIDGDLPAARRPDFDDGDARILAVLGSSRRRHSLARTVQLRNGTYLPPRDALCSSIAQIRNDWTSVF